MFASVSQSCEQTLCKYKFQWGSKHLTAPAMVVCTLYVANYLALTPSAANRTTNC